MPKYKLINSVTKEEHTCDKITIDGFDYYYDNTFFGDREWYYDTAQGTLRFASNNHLLGGYKKKIIATNNSAIDISQIIDEVERLKHTYNEGNNKDVFTKGVLTGIEIGYSKSQETHLFSEDDVLMFDEWKNKNYKSPHNDSIYVSVTDYYNVEDLKSCQHYTTKELFQLWKEQPKTLYYE